MSSLMQAALDQAVRGRDFKQGAEIADMELSAELPWNSRYDEWPRHKQIGYELTRQRLIQEKLYPDEPLALVRDHMLRSAFLDVFRSLPNYESV